MSYTAFSFLSSHIICHYFISRNLFITSASHLSLLCRRISHILFDVVYLPCLCAIFYLFFHLSSIVKPLCSIFHRQSSIFSVLLSSIIYSLFSFVYSLLSASSIHYPLYSSLRFHLPLYLISVFSSPDHLSSIICISPFSPFYSPSTILYLIASILYSPTTRYLSSIALL